MNQLVGLILFAMAGLGVVPLCKALAQDFKTAAAWVRKQREHEMQQIKITLDYRTYLILDATSANLGVATALLEAECCGQEYYQDYEKHCLVVTTNPIKVEVGTFEVFDVVPQSNVVLLEAAE
jgi:hypothetical protein